MALSFTASGRLLQIIINDEQSSLVSSLPDHFQCHVAKTKDDIVQAMICTQSFNRRPLKTLDLDTMLHGLAT